MPDQARATVATTSPATGCHSVASIVASTGPTTKTTSSRTDSSAYAVCTSRGRSSRCDHRVRTHAPDLGQEGAGERGEDVGERRRPVAGDRRDEQRHRRREAGDGQRQHPPLAEARRPAGRAARRTPPRRAPRPRRRCRPARRSPVSPSTSSTTPSVTIDDGQAGHEPGRAEAAARRAGTARGGRSRASRDARPHVGWRHESRRVAVRRPPAPVLRRSGEARGRRALPRERHPRAAASRASGSRRWGSTTSSSAGAARSTTRTAPCSPRSARTWPAAASTCRSTGATATGTPTSPTPCARCATTASSGRRSSPRRRTRRTPRAGSTARTSPTRSPRSRAPRAWSGCGSTTTTRASWSPSWTPRSRAMADLPDAVREGAELVFVTHSIPTAMAETSGPPLEGGNAYVRQHLAVAEEITAPGAPGDRPPAQARARLLLALRLAARPVAGARRQRPPRRPRQARGHAPW